MAQAEPKTDLAPSFDKFRACVLDAYAPIMRDMGFVELDPRRGEQVNKFAVRIGNGKVVIEVEGINYGFAAWTKLFRASASDDDRYGLPIKELLRRRQGVGARETRRQRKRRRQSPDQLGDIRNAAEAIFEHAKDVLEGDFSALDEIVEQERLLLREQRVKALSREAKAAVVAASEAGHAFKQGDYRKVIALLEPHLSHLTPSQLRRLEIAQRALAER